MAPEGHSQPIGLDPRVYALVTDSRRIEMLQLIQAHGPITVKDLAELLSEEKTMSPGAVNYHLAELSEAGWIEVVGFVPRRRLPAKLWAVKGGVDWRSVAVAANALLERRDT